jgi:protein SCO1/2
MAQRSTTTATGDDTGRVLDGGFRLVVVAAVLFGVLLVWSALWGQAPPNGAGLKASPSASSSASAPSPAPSVDVSAFLARDVVAAPPVELIDQDGRPFSLTSLRGSPTFVFFGYTHCPDVCPATIGTVGKAIETTDLGARAVFVTVDPSRDTAAWLKEFLTYLPARFIALTGSDAEIRTAAGAWGVRYARVETGVADGYSMAHTADVYLVDRSGALRATFPFGTSPEAMAAVLRTVVAESGSAAPSIAPPTPIVASTPAVTTSAETPLPSAAGASAPATAGLEVKVVSTSVWSGPPAPVILSLSTGGVHLDDPGLYPAVLLMTTAGEPVGVAVQAIPVQPPGVPAVSYVATIAIPQPGSWRLAVTAPLGSVQAAGAADVTALDPGTTAAVGAPAPSAHTPTLADVGGAAKAVTTDPAPDLRLSRRSTTDALAEGQPFVLVVDSTKFRVSPACGRAIIMARYMLDRWPLVGFIHLEPYRYSVITDTPVLDGTLADPTLTDPAAAWGIGGDPWGPRSMPWVFIVDGSGTVRAKYQGVMGSDDIDVIVALIAQGG